MRNIKLLIEYDGRHFNGWQKQPDKLNIQGEIERAIKDVTGEDVDLIGSGRTDAGVHALGQVANFKIESDKIPIDKIPVALNSKLKNSIRIIDAEEVGDLFHSRYSVHSKTYKYVIDNSLNGTAIFREFVYHVSKTLDINAMKKAIKYFEGEHDFKAFKASGTSSKNSIRTIYKAEIIEKGSLIEICLTGNGFMYNMVRIIAGTLVDVGLCKIKPDEIVEIIDSKDRTRAREDSSRSRIIFSGSKL